MESVLKWVGGKRQLLDELIPIIQPKLNGCNRYYEPFVGGGSVAFALEYKNTIINDLNSELINVYKMIKEKPKFLTYLLTYLLFTKIIIILILIIFMRLDK